MVDQRSNSIMRPDNPARWWPARRILMAVVFVVVALFALAIWQFPLSPLIEALGTADRRYLLAALLANLAIFPFWVWQWRVLSGRFRRVPWPDMARVVALSLCARVTVSGIGGVASGGAALHLEAGLTPQQAASVMSLDQILAGLTKILVLVLALMFVLLPDAIGSSILAALLVFLAFLGGFAALTFFKRSPAPRLRPRLVIVEQVLNWVAGFVRDLRTVAGLPVLVPAAALAVLKKALEVMAAYAIQTALGIDGSWALALLVVASVSVVSLLPLAPVQLGPQALAVFSIYMLFDVPAALAVSAGVIHQAVVLIALGAVGLVAFAAGPVLTRPNSTP